MNTPRKKGVGTAGKHRTTTPKKDNIDFAECTPGVMTRSQIKLKDVKSTPKKNSRKCSAKPASGLKRSVRSEVSSSDSLSTNRQKREDLDVSDNPDLTATPIKDDSVRTSKTLYNRYSEVSKNLEDEMNEEVDKVKKISTPQVKVKQTLVENKLLPDTSKEYMTRSRRSVANKFESDVSGKRNEPKQINSVKDKCAEIVSESEASQNAINKDEIRLTRSVSKKFETKFKSRRSVSKKLENDRNDEDKDTEVRSPSDRESVNECTEISDESKQPENKEGNAKTGNNISKKLENDKSSDDVQIRSQHSDTLNENKLSPSTIKGSKAKSSVSNELETEMSDTDNEFKKKYPEVRENIDTHIVNNSDLSPKTNKDKCENSISKKLENDTSDEDIDNDKSDEDIENDKSDEDIENDKSDEDIENDKGDEDTENDKGDDIENDKSDDIENDKSDEDVENDKSDENIENDKSDEDVENDTSDEDNESNEIKSPEVRKDVDENPEILSDCRSPRKAKLKRNESKKLEVGTDDGDNEANAIITSEVRKIIDEYAKTRFDSKSYPKIDKDKSEYEELESDSSGEDNEHNRIESPKIRKDVDKYPEVLYDDKSPPKTKLKRSISKKFEDDTSDENNVTKQVRSPEIKKRINECPEILYESKSSPIKNQDRTKLKRSISKKFEDDTSDGNNVTKQVRSPEIKKRINECPEILYESKSSPIKNQDRTKLKRSSVKKTETGPLIENYISDSGSESGKVKLSSKENKQQVAGIEGHVSENSSEAETIIFKNTGKTLLLSDSLKSDKRKKSSGGNQKTVEDNILPSHEEKSPSVDEIFASSSGVTVPQREKILNKKFSSPKKNKGGKEFQIEGSLSMRDRVSSCETVLLPKTTKQPHISPFKNQTKEGFKSESSDSDSDAESRKAIRESAQKRIIQNISTSESDSKFMRPVAKLYDEQTDSESAPEEMSFSAGRKLEMESLKNVVESINKDKQRRKERRKQRLEKYKQQKEEKLIRLKEKRASQEDASCSSSEESGYEEDAIAVTLGRSKKKQRPKLEKENVDDPLKGKITRYNISEDEVEIKERKENKRKHEQMEDQVKIKEKKEKKRKHEQMEDEVEIKERKEKKRKHEQMEVPQNIGNLRKLPSDVLESLPDHISLKVPKFDKEMSSVDKRKSNKSEIVKDKRQDFRSCSDLDYIPLTSYGSTEFGVMPLEMLSRSSKSMAKQAADFKQRMLYGPHIKRAPANAHLVYQQKLKAAGRDRFTR